MQIAMSKAEFFPANDPILPVDFAPRSLGVAETRPPAEEAEVLVLSKPRRGFSRQELAHFSETVDAAVEGAFPKARYLIGRAEFDYWRQEEAGLEDHSKSPFHDSVAPVFEAGLVDLVETDHKVCEEVSLEPTLGHTPGHVSIRIRSRGQQALITGDFAHHPCQLAHPEWASTADYDTEASTETRRRMFGSLAGDGTLVIGTHFAAPTAGHVVADGDVWRLAV